MWSLSSRSYFVCFLPLTNFYLATFSNLLGPPYGNQSSLPNINMYLGFEKNAIGFLSLFSLDFRANILLLSSISRQNNIKGEKNFPRFKLFVWSLVLYRGIRLEELFHRFSLFFSSSFVEISNSKSFFTLDSVKSIKNIVRCFLRQLKIRLSII